MRIKINGWIELSSEQLKDLISQGENNGLKREHNSIRKILENIFSDEKYKNGLFLTATEIRDIVSDNSPLIIYSFKQLGMELKLMFGESKYMDRQRKYFVYRK